MPTPTTKPIITSSYTFNTIDVPNTLGGTLGAASGSTVVTALNDSGELTGYFSTTVGFNFTTPATLGFTDKGGAFTSLKAGNVSTTPVAIDQQGDLAVTGTNGGFINVSDSPYFYNAQNGSLTLINAPLGGTFFGVEATAINSSGAVVGGPFRAIISPGFEFANGVLTSIRAPGADVTSPSSINDKGDIAGTDFTFIHNPDGTIELSGGVEKGFIDTNGSFTTLAVPGATNTLVAGINIHDEVIGTYLVANSSGQHAYTFLGGKYTTIDPPGASSTNVAAINNQGAVVGNYLTSGGFIPNRDSRPTAGEHGFVYNNGQTTIIDVPGATGTDIVGINNKGEIAGNYTNASGVHGFTAVDPHTFDFSSVSPTTFAPPASGTILIDPSPSGASMSMSTSLVDPSLLVTPHTVT